MLLQGPENSSYTKAIPENTNLISAELKNDCVELNFSKEFIGNFENITLKANAIYSIVNTLTELTEVNSVKFLFEGEETEAFSDCNIDLKNPIERKL